MNIDLTQELPEAWTPENCPARIHAILAAINRSQAALAKIIGVHPVTLNRWVKSRALPDARAQVALNQIERRFIKCKP